MPEPITSPKPPDVDNPAAEWSLGKPEPKATTETQPKPDTLTQRAAKMLERIAGAKDSDGSQTETPQVKNPDDLFQEIAKPPTLQEKIDEANDQLNAARKAYVEAGYGIKGMFTNTEQAKHQYTKSLQEMRALKIEELHKQLAENPSLAQQLIETTMLDITKGEFLQLRQTENDLWNERPGSKLTETGKKLLEWYGGINKRVSEKILGKDARLATQISGTLATGFLINTGVSLATFGTLTIPMRILGGAVSAERYKAGVEALAGQMR